MGAIEVGPSFSKALAGVHGGWFLFLILEASLSSTQVPSWSFWLGLCLALTGQLLRRSALTALGERWVMVNLVVPGERRIETGPYRWVRHPNYLGVSLELVGFPLIWGAHLTAVWGVIAYLAILARRLKFEEKALAEHTRP